MALAREVERRDAAHRSAMLAARWSSASSRGMRTGVQNPMYGAIHAQIATAGDAGGARPPMNALLHAAVPAAAGYLLGSIPVADLVARRGAVDLRRVGDGNPGYWNARASFGRRAALPVLVGDIAKGAAAAAVGRFAAASGDWRPPVVATGAAMAGHAWPVFAGFRGGRAVATFIGGALVLSPRAGAVATAGGCVVGAAAGSFPRGVHAGFVAYPLAQLVVDGRVRTAATGALMTFIGLRFLTARTPDHASGGAA